MGNYEIKTWLLNIPAALASSEKLNELISAHIQELFEIYTTVGIFPERPFSRSLVRHVCNFYAPRNCTQGIEIISK